MPLKTPPRPDDTDFLLSILPRALGVGVSLFALAAVTCGQSPDEAVPFTGDPEHLFAAPLGLYRPVLLPDSRWLETKRCAGISSRVDAPPENTQRQCGLRFAGLDRAAEEATL